MRGYPFAPIQILTGDTRKPRNARRGRLHDDSRSFQPKSRIERRFESRVAGRSPACFLCYFLHDAKSDNPFSLSGDSRFRKPRFSAQNYNFARTKLKPFAASRLHWRLRRFFSALRRCPCRDGTLRVLFFAACGGFIFVAAATNFAASREYACSASKNAGKSNAFAGISHKFLISFL